MIFSHCLMCLTRFVVRTFLRKEKIQVVAAKTAVNFKVKTDLYSESFVVLHCYLRFHYQ